MALSSLMRSNPVKLASWSTRKVPLPTNARTSVPAPPVRLSPAFSVAAVAYTVEPEDGATIVSLPVVRPTTPGEGGGAAYVPVWSMMVSTELVAKIAVALIGGEGEALAIERVLPGTAGNLKRRAQVADREGRAQAVGAGDREPAHRRVGQVERRSCGHQLVVLPTSIEGLDARRIGVVDQEGDVVATAVNAHMRERIRGQIVGYRQRREDPLIVEKLKFVVADVSEASPLMMLLPFQFDGEFT